MPFPCVRGLSVSSTLISTYVNVALIDHLHICKILPIVLQVLPVKICCIIRHHPSLSIKPSNLIVYSIEAIEHVLADERHQIKLGRQELRSSVLGKNRGGRRDFEGARSRRSMVQDVNADSTSSSHTAPSQSLQTPPPPSPPSRHTHLANTTPHLADSLSQRHALRLCKIWLRQTTASGLSLQLLW